MPNLVRSAWQRWKTLAEKIGHVQARLMFCLLYFLVVTPFALALKAFADPLRLRPAVPGPLWRPLARQTLSLEDARRQF